MSSSILLFVLAVGAPPAEQAASAEQPSRQATAPVARSSAPRRIQTVAPRRRGLRAILAQQLGPANQFGDNAQAGNANLARVIPQVINPGRWQQDGGAGRIALFQRGGGGGGAAGRRNGAEALVDLIQEIVEPDSWDINGGPGVISIFGQ
jgi:hypothetical protein